MSFNLKVITIIIFSSSIFLNAYCRSKVEKDKSSLVVIKGKIKNPSRQKYDINYFDIKGLRSYQRLVQFEVDSSGNFSTNIMIDEPIQAFIDCKNNQTIRLFLQPDKNLQLTFDEENVEKTIRFNNSCNQFMNTGFTTFFKLWAMKNPSERGQVSFYQFTDSIRKTYYRLINECEKQESLTVLESKYIYLETETFIYSQLAYYGANNNIDPCDDFYNFLDKLVFNDEIILSNFYCALSEDYFLPNLYIRKGGQKKNLPAYYNYLDTLQSNKKIKDWLLGSLILNNISKTNRDTINYLTSLYKKTNPEIKSLNLIEKEIKRFYDEDKVDKNVVVDKKAKEIEAFTSKENVVKLSDYANKLVLIELWATWCKPCIKEKEFTKDLLEKFKNRKDFVVFIISLDHDKAAWVNKIQKENYSNAVHLHVNNGFESDLAKNYSITSIPRFILIGKNGEFINFNAPYPSSGKLEKLITDNL